MIRGNDIKFDSDVAFTTFDAALKDYEEYSKLKEMQKVILHEYYLFKLKTKE